MFRALQRANILANHLKPSTFKANMSAAAATTAAPQEETKHYALHYNYVPDAFEKRAPFRAAHLALTARYKSVGKMLMGGAYTEAPMGALLTFYAPKSEVEEFVKQDPYVVNNVVTDYKIREWTVVVGSQSNPNYAGSEGVKTGDAFPKNVQLQEGTPTGVVDMDKLLAGKRVVIFGVPGAFTPGCSKTHLPGFVADAEKIKSKGKIDEIICVATNDPFVMAAWGEAHQAGGKVRMLSDPNGELTKRLGLALNRGGILRSKRYSLIVENGQVVQANVEPEANPTGLTCSLATALKL